MYDAASYAAGTFFSFVRAGSVAMPEDYADTPDAQVLAAALRSLNVESSLGTAVGHGQYGVAFAYSPARILKITSDISEVRASAVIAGRTLGNVVRIESAYLVRDLLLQKAGKTRRVGVILQERVAPIPDEVADELDSVVAEVKKELEVYPRHLALLSPTAQRARLKDASKKLAERLRAAEAPWARDVAAGIDELWALGVYDVDTHGGNVGIGDGGQYKIFDIGSSSAPKSPEPGVLPLEGVALVELGREVEVEEIGGSLGGMAKATVAYEEPRSDEAIRKLHKRSEGGNARRLVKYGTYREVPYRIFKEKVGYSFLIGGESRGGFGFMSDDGYATPDDAEATAVRMIDETPKRYGATGDAGVNRASEHVHAADCGCQHSTPAAEDPWDAKVRNCMSALGSRDPDADMRASLVWLKNSRASGMAPGVAAGIAYATLHHGHPHHAQMAAESPTRETWHVYVRGDVTKIEQAAGRRGDRTGQGVRFAFDDDEKAMDLARTLTKAGFIVSAGPSKSFALAAEANEESDYTHMQFMFAWYARHHDLGDYLKNSATPTGQKVQRSDGRGETGVWMFYTQIPGGSPQRREITDEDLRRSYAEHHAHEAGEHSAACPPGAAPGQVVGLQHTETDTVLVAGEDRGDGKSRILRWHRADDGQSYDAKGALGTYRLAQRTPDRRHGVRPWTLTLHRKEVRPGGFDSKSEAQDFAQAWDDIVPHVPHREGELTVDPASSAALYRGAKLIDGCTPWISLRKDPEKASACVARMGKIDGGDDVYRLLADTVNSYDVEVFGVILLDVQDQGKGIAEVARGQRSRVVVEPSECLRYVLASGATSWMAFHCHPSGSADPSRSDISLTKALERANRQAVKDHILAEDVKFKGHYVIGRGEWGDCSTGKVHKVKDAAAA